MVVKIGFFLPECCHIMYRESCAELQINVNFWENLLLKITLETLLRNREDTYPRVAAKGGDFIRINDPDVFFFSGNEWMSLTDFEKKLYILITNLMHWLLFIYKILFSSTCFEPQVLIFRRIQLYKCSLYYCHSLWEFLVACRYIAVYRQATRNSHREWQYHMLHVYNCILLKMSTWGSKHVEENNILWMHNNQCIKLVINIR